MAQQTSADPPRRGRKPKRHDMQPASATDGGRGGEELGLDVASSEPELLAKARRGRKPRVPPAPQPSIAGDDSAHPTAEPAEHAHSPVGSTPLSAAADEVSVSKPEALAVKSRRKSGGQPGPQSPAAKAGESGRMNVPSVDSGAPVSRPSAAHWNSATGTATFDWPAIEQVAAEEGPNQAMARLLLAARAEGANSRWPF